MATSVVVFLGSCFAAFAANLWRWVDCCSELGLTPSPWAERQFLVAALGIVPAVGMLVESVRGRRSAWYWLLATFVVYGVWGVLVAVWVS